MDHSGMDHSAMHSGSSGTHTSARDVLTGALERYLEQRQANGGSNDRISLNSILTSEQLARFNRLRQTGQLQLQNADMNHDGVIDASDLPFVLEALSGTSVSDLPPRLRDALLRAADTNGDGEINQGDIEPMVQSLVGSETGRAILDLLRNPDGTYDPRALAQVFAELVQLGSQPPAADGHLNLSNLSPDVRQVLLDHLDLDNDGALTPADVATFVVSLTRRAPPNPPEPNPPPQAISPPFPPHMPGHGGTGEITLPPSIPAVVMDDATASLSPDAAAGMAAGSVFAVLLSIFGSMCFICVIVYAIRGWRKKRAPDRRRMLDANISATGGVGTPGFATDYAAPLPQVTPVGGQCWGAAESGSATHNTDALSRARAANASASNGIGRV